MHTVGVDINAAGQPVGVPVPGWTNPARPAGSLLVGRYCRLEHLDPERHADQLFAANRHDTTGESWTYLPYGPFADVTTYRRWAEQAGNEDDPLFYAVIEADSEESMVKERAVGVLSYLRIQPEMGSVEVGHIHYSPLLQRRRGATEAQALMMRHAFDLGYRRYEWKCDALNAPSRSAAERLGFRYEGTFRQAAIVKGRNRDTAWYSIIDIEWPTVRGRLAAWLDPRNFDEHGCQKEALPRIGPSG